MPRKVEIIRCFFEEKQTRGYLSVLDSNNKVLAEFVTIELPWRNNARKISCIPAGTYHLTKRYSEKYGHHFHIKDVPNRSMILIHNGNYYNQTNGCILVGDDFVDINNDGIQDVTNSKAARRKLLSYLDQDTTITIT